MDHHDKPTDWMINDELLDLNAKVDQLTTTNDYQARYIRTLESHQSNLVATLLRALDLTGALIAELGVLQQQTGRPIALGLIAAKQDLDKAIGQLLKPKDD